jgi:hypothetical protein
VSEKHLFVPAISREVEFTAHNVDTMVAVWESQPKSTLGELIEAVSKRANTDADKLLRALEVGISHALSGIVRIRWVNTNRGENWESQGKLYMPRGPMRRIGLAGLTLGEAPTPLRLFGWIWPRRGGSDGRRELVHRCQKKVRAVCLPHQNPARYPDWTEDDGVIWLDEQLSLRTPMRTIIKDVSHQAKVFFRATKPMLKELSER